MTKGVAFHHPSHSASYVLAKTKTNKKQQKQSRMQELQKVKATTHSVNVGRAFLSALGSMESVANAFLKPIYQTVGLAGAAAGAIGTSLPKGVVNLGDLASNTKNFIAGPKCFLSITNFFGSAAKVFKEEKGDKTSKIERSAQLFFKLNTIPGDAYDFFNLLWQHGVVKAANATMKRLKVVQYTSLGIGNIKDIVVAGKQMIKGEKIDRKTGKAVNWGEEGGKKIGRRKLTSSQKTHRTMNIAKNVSFIGLAAIGLVGIVFAWKVALGVLICATLATLFWNVAYYYKNLAKPDEKAQYAWLKNHAGHVKA